MAASIFLRGMNGPVKGRTWQFSEVIRIGRLERSDVVLEDNSVSRNHAEIRLTNQRWRLRDLNSTNGTRINGVRLNESRILRIGDWIQFGEVAVIVDSMGGLTPLDRLECSRHLEEWLTAFKEICHSTRKLRLFAAACSWIKPEEFSAATILEAERYLDRLASGAKRRLIAQSSSFELSQAIKKVAVSRAIRVAERHADGQGTDEELRLACWYLEYFERYNSPEFMACSSNPYQSFIAQLADIRMAQDPQDCARTIGKYEWPQRMDIQEFWCGNVHGVLRDIADPWPVGSITLDPAWLAWNSRTVWKMAKVIYDEHRFDEMPALGDALEDAGCEEKKVLSHCREPGEHWRGCWLIDLLLGKC